MHKINEAPSPGLAAGLVGAAAIVAERARRAAEVAMQEERQRLALELDDGVAAMLSTIGNGLRAMLQELPAGDAIQARLNDLEDQAGQAAAALRGSLRALGGESQQTARD